MRKRLKVPDSFQERFLKRGWGTGLQGLWPACGYSSDGLVGRWLGINIINLWFQPVWVLHACGQHAVNFFHLGGLSGSAKQLKDVAQNIFYSPWRGAKVPWLCLMPEQLLFCLAWLFPFVFSLCSFPLHFLTSPIKFALGDSGRA